MTALKKKKSGGVKLVLLVQTSKWNDSVMQVLSKLVSKISTLTYNRENSFIIKNDIIF